MNAEHVPFENLPPDVQAFLLRQLGEAIKTHVFNVKDNRLIIESEEPTTATHTLRIRADGSYAYYEKSCEFWG